MQEPQHTFTTRVSFYDTDAMGVMHHAAHLRKMEDARVDWLRAENIDSSHFPCEDMVLAVIKAEIEYVKPSQFDQILKIHLKFKKTGLKLFIEYVMCNELEETIAKGLTVHVPLDRALKVRKYPQAILDVLKRISD